MDVRSAYPPPPEMAGGGGYAPYIRPMPRPTTPVAMQSQVYGQNPNNVSMISYSEPIDPFDDPRH